MKEIGVKRKDIQRAMGLKTEGAVRHYFCGRRSMTVEQMQVMARVLKWSVAELLGENERIEFEPGPAGVPPSERVPEPQPVPHYQDAIVLSRDELDMLLTIYRPIPKERKPMIRRIFAKVAKEISRTRDERPDELTV
jgi:hypothetical protein